MMFSFGGIQLCRWMSLHEGTEEVQSEKHIFRWLTHNGKIHRLFSNDFVHRATETEIRVASIGVVRFVSSDSVVVCACKIYERINLKTIQYSTWFRLSTRAHRVCVCARRNISLWEMLTCTPRCDVNNKKENILNKFIWNIRIANSNA